MLVPLNLEYLHLEFNHSNAVLWRNRRSWISTVEHEDFGTANKVATGSEFLNDEGLSPLTLLFLVVGTASIIFTTLCCLCCLYISVRFRLSRFCSSSDCLSFVWNSILSPLQILRLFNHVSETTFDEYMANVENECPEYNAPDLINLGHFSHSETSV